MRDKILDRFIQEEVERTVNRMNLSSPKVLGDVLKELFTFSTDTFLKNIGSQEAILDDKDSLPVENWDWLMETLNQAFQENQKEWFENLKEQKIKILCYKYFTKQDFIKLDEVERSLKVNVKKYFSALQNFVDMDDFREKFFNLPFELLSNFCRYILNKSRKLNAKLKIDKNELRERIKQLKDDRKNVIQKISLVSHKYQSTLDLKLVKELYDNGLFFEDNFLNRGINEYITKLLNHKEALQHIRDLYNTAFANDLLSQSENNPAYVNHIESIKKEEGKEYFTFRGMQVGSRFDNEIEVANAKEGSKAGYVIDKDSRFKEPNAKIKDTTLPWEKSEDGEGLEGTDGTGSDTRTSSGGSGGSSGGGGGLASGGGINYEPPELGPAETGDGEDIDLGGEEGTGEEGDEDSMPTDEDGLPVDFGTPESNPEGVEKAKEK